MNPQNPESATPLTDELLREMGERATVSAEWSRLREHAKTQESRAIAAEAERDELGKPCPEFTKSEDGRISIVGEWPSIVRATGALMQQFIDAQNELIDLRTKLAEQADTRSWSQELPDEQALWWWWNGDEDSSPIPVNIAYSGTNGNYFATCGQWGWEEYRELSDMGGWWMRCVEPPPPEEGR